MKLFTAYVCYSCQEVLDGAPHGRCHACNSDAVYPLSWLGRPEEERSKWLNLISGQNGRRSAQPHPLPV